MRCVSSFLHPSSKACLSRAGFCPAALVTYRERDNMRKRVPAQREDAEEVEEEEVETEEVEEEEEEPASRSPVTRSPRPSDTLQSTLRSRQTSSSPSSSSSPSFSSSFSPVNTWFSYTSERPWLTYTTDVNVLWWVVVILSFVTRFWRIDYPHYVVFDEVHFGKFASYYLTRTFFFDVHPPLGKLIFAALGYSTGFNGSFLFTTIGIEYPRDVPYVLMRSASGLAGSLLVPCIYQIMIELGFTHRAAFLASLFTILDNSLIIQSRVIMLDSFVILFSYLSILCYLKFYHLRHRPFSGAWHRALIATGLSLGTLLGVKYTGLLGLGCVGLLTLCDLWQLIADTTIDLLDFLLHFLLRGIYMLGIPLLISLVLFFIHFSVLINSGPGNAFVSKPFRKTLEGTVEITNEPVEISTNATLLRYGSHISLKSMDSLCWLHSHPHLYPLKYPDDRGSSYQQQITCYEFADINNLWEIRRHDGETPGDQQSHSNGPVLNRDLVELVHVNTTKILNSHDVAAPLTPTHQEVAGYINYSAQFVPHFEWRLDVKGVEDGGHIFHEKGKVKLQFIHEFSKQALSCTGKRLPEWAFQQYEVVTDRDVEATSALWSLDDVVLPTVSNVTVWNEEERAIREKLQRLSVKSDDDEETEPEHGLNFWEKYIELQVHMATAHGNLGEHQFGATPQNWPLMGKLLPYWLDEKSNAQVTLIGNPVMWWVATASVILFLLVTGVYLLRRRRRIFDLPHGEDAVFHHWWTSGCVLLVGWLAHYIPYFLLSRVLFLHHYLPAIPFKLMLLAAMCDHFHWWLKRFHYPYVHLLYHLLVSLLLISFFISFLIFAPFTYGYPGLSRDQIQWRKWYSTWDLLHR